MTSLIPVKDIYNRVAVACGFPTYTNDTDTPDTTRFILEMISEGVQSTIDILNSHNACLDMKEEIMTIPNVDSYSVTGIVKQVELLNNGRVTKLPYNNSANFMRTNDEHTPKGMPTSYVMDAGYIRLYPIPDKNYKIMLRISTDDLVLSDNDTSRSYVEHINDSIIATQELGVLITLRTITLVLLRCQSPNARIYSELQKARFNTFLERDFASNEAKRLFNGHTGHYNPDRGLLG